MSSKVSSKDLLGILKRDLRVRQAGDRLPTVRELMHQYGVSQSVVSQALAILRHEGMIASQVGRGTYVVDTASHRRVLWVCGLDVFQGEVSPFYTQALSIARDRFGEAGIAIEPVWLASKRPEDAASWCTEELCERFASIVFLGCRPDHALLRFAAWKQLPYLHVKSGASSLHDVVISQVRRAGEIVRFIQERQLDHLALLVDEHNARIFPEFGAIAGIRFDVLPCAVQHATLADFQWAGYQAISQYLEHHPLPASLYIQDDIIAQGAARALQVHASAAQLERMQIIISTSLQTLVPFAIPASYHVFDIRDYVDSILCQLQAQLAGREIETVAPVSFTIIERPTVAELAHTREKAL